MMDIDAPGPASAGDLLELEDRTCRRIEPAALPVRLSPRPEKPVGPTFEYDRMVTTAGAVEELVRSVSAAGRRMPAIVLSSHVEAKLSAWARMLTEAGCRVCVCPSNPASVARGELEWLRQQRITVLEWDVDSQPSAHFWSDMCDFSPSLLLDDGARLIRAFRSVDAPRLDGAVEFTTSGHRALQSGGDLPFPIFDVGKSYCKYELGNAAGTGWSAMAAIAAAVNVYIPLQRVLVIGYGAVGRGVASAAAKMGARVRVVDHRVSRQAQARLDGYEIGALQDLAVTSDLVITCSGSTNSLTLDVMTHLPDGAIIANVGCFADEIDLQALHAAADRVVRRDRQVVSYWFSGGKQLHVLANAELVNLAVGRGWPIELIDLCFGLSTICFAELAISDLAPALYAVPRALEERALRLFVGTA